MTDDRDAAISRPAALAMTRPGPVRKLNHDIVARRALEIGRRTARGILAGDHATADDVAQEVAIQAIRHVHRLRDPAALDAWLYRTATRAALRAARRAGRRRDVEQRHAAFRSACEEPSTLDDLDRLLTRLPARQRAALTLRYVHDLDDDDIAAALGCRPGTVRALLSRGRTALRPLLSAPLNSPTPGEPRA